VFDVAGFGDVELAEIRTLAAGNPAALAALDRLVIRPGQGTQPGS